ncbi:hypothetical protein D3C78_1375380 [compost metagenome]
MVTEVIQWVTDPIITGQGLDVAVRIVTVRILIGINHTGHGQGNVIIQAVFCLFDTVQLIISIITHHIRAAHRSGSLAYDIAIV